MNHRSCTRLLGRVQWRMRECQNILLRWYGTKRSGNRVADDDDGKTTTSTTGCEVGYKIFRGTASRAKEPGRHARMCAYVNITCICIYIYICLRTRICKYIQIHIQPYIYIYINMHARIFMYVYIYIYICIHMYVYMHIHVCLSVCLSVSLHTCLFVHVHTYTCIFVPSNSLED